MKKKRAGVNWRESKTSPKLNQWQSATIIKHETKKDDAWCLHKQIKVNQSEAKCIIMFPAMFWRSTSLIGNSRSLGLTHVTKMYSRIAATVCQTPKSSVCFFRRECHSVWLWGLDTCFNTIVTLTKRCKTCRILLKQWKIDVYWIIMSQALQIYDRRNGNYDDVEIFQPTDHLSLESSQGLQKQ